MTKDAEPLMKKMLALISPVASRPLLSLGLLWLLMHLLLYHKYGVRIVFDSHRYLAYATSVETGTTYWQQADSVFYASYTFFIYLVLYVLRLPLETIIVMQVLVSGVATIFFYKTLYAATSSRIAAFFGALLYLIWPQIHSWNFYIHTESLYISFTIFILYYIRKLPYNGWKHFLIITLLLCFSLFLRPNGLFLTLGVIAGYTFHSRHRFRRGYVLLSIALLAPILLFGANLVLEVYSPIQYLLQGQAIQGYDSVSVEFSTQELPEKEPVLLQIASFILEQPLAYSKLLLLRFGYLWGQVRPYYSSIHNIAIVVFFLPVYTLALRGVWKAFKDSKSIFMLTVMLLQTIMAMVVAVDWDNRFVAPLLPFVFYFAAVGFGSYDIVKLTSYKICTPSRS
ncbi:hypothetical protein [Pontibacter litorisediminis]|uniref:hypothetical protein n=1 Tax=Pontibacter litorisediminis TaxID=1846260 RepID=UPI0023EC0A6A|nr:hypothetical protein [Pontibacter litorisediminis]